MPFKSKTVKLTSSPQESLLYLERVRFYGTKISLNTKTMMLCVHNTSTIAEIVDCYHWLLPILDDDISVRLGDQGVVNVRTPWGQYMLGMLYRAHGYNADQMVDEALANGVTEEDRVEADRVIAHFASNGLPTEEC